MITRLGVAVLAIATSLVGCADESDPATWVKRLDDPARRAAAIQRLEAFHDEALKRADGGHVDPGVEKIDAVVLEPLARAYAAGGLDDATRSGLMKLLASSSDARTAPALTKALETCSGAADDDTRLAAESVATIAKRGDALSRALVDALWSCFAKYAPSKGSARVGDALQAAVLAVRDASYTSKAIAMLSPPIDLADSLSPSGARKINDPLDQWQPTAIRLLGALRDKAGVRPLVVVLMTRGKLALAPLATVALAEMARDAEPVLAAALDGTDAELAKLRADWARDDGYVPLLVAALAATSLDSARDAVLAAIPAMATQANRTAAAESLVWFVATQKLLETYQAVFARLPPIAHVGQDDLGIERAALLQAAGDLFEPRLVSWILSESAGAKGEMMLAAKASALVSAIKLMQPQEEARVASAIDALENHSGLSPMERAEIATNVHALFDAAGKALHACGADASCYVGVLDEPIPPASNAHWKAIKAAYMAGVLGDDKTRKALVSRMSKAGNPGVRQAMALAILHLAPSGDAADADALQASGASDESVAKVARMLRARAGR